MDKEGWIALHRKTIESDIWSKPPLYFKVWCYLLLEATHSAYGKLERGQVFITIDMIRDACAYYVGYRKLKPTRREVRDVLDWLRRSHEGPTKGTTKGPMIVTTKVTHGMLANIVNYDVYQDVKTHEGHDESRAKGTTKVQRRSREGQDKNNNVTMTTIKESSTLPEIESHWNLLPDTVPKIGQLEVDSVRGEKTLRLVVRFGKDKIIKAIDNISKSTFLVGGGNSGWVISFDWFIRPENFQKVLEGNYTDKAAPASTALYTGEITDEMRELYGNKSWG